MLTKSASIGAPATTGIVISCANALTAHTEMATASKAVRNTATLDSETPGLHTAALWLCITDPAGQNRAGE
jgi:hypothetical protein